MNIDKISIEVSFEVAEHIVSKIMIQDYKLLQDNDWYEGDKEKLLDAFRVVMDYCITKDELKANGIVL